MFREIRPAGWVLAATLAWGFNLEAWSQTYQASHACAGYTSPGTITVSCQFDYTNTNAFDLFSWRATLPAGWVAVAATGGGYLSWDIYEWDGDYYLSPNGTPPQGVSQVTFTYTIAVPAGQSGPKNIAGEAEYWFRGMRDPNYVQATPDPFVIDSHCRLQVISQYGSPSPAVGVHTNLIGTLLSPSVAALAYAGPTQYVCTGWSMTGHEPASGTGNSFSMTVTNAAVLTWNWAVDNIAPTVDGEARMTGYRTRANVLTEASLLSHASDPDGDPVTLTAVDATSACGGTITRQNGVLTYTPPKLTDAVLDSFTFTVEDGRGGSATGVVNVKVNYGGSAIRVF